MSRQKGFSVILVVIIALIIGVGGILTYQHWFGRVSLMGKQSRQKIQVVNDMDNWKTYRNEGLGFEIKYPSYWGYHNETRFDKDKTWMISFAKNKAEYLGKGSALEIYIISNKERLNLKDWWYKNKYKLLGEPDSMFGGVTTFTDYGDGGCGFSSFWEKGDYVYEGVMSFSGTEYNKTFEKMKLYYQILSTFKVID